MNNPYTWQQMLDGFRTLGGKAENIEQRVGQFGNGIFPLDPAAPIAIAIPAPLLVDADQLILDGADLVVSPATDVPDEVRNFINRYQKHFSWGANGRKHVDAFESALKTLPDTLLARLRQIGLLNLAVRHKGPWDEVLRQSFLQSRRISYHGRKVSMPIIELINHSAKSPGYLVNDGIQAKGRFADEVTVNYSSTIDALQRFLIYGFASQEPAAYSLPMHLQLNGGETIHIGYEGDSIHFVNQLPLPKVTTEAKRRKLSHLRLGAERAPRLPRTLLRKALPDLPVENADELFDRFRSANELALYELLELADGVDTPIGKEFRLACLYQLRAMAHCHGVRPD